MGNPSHPNYLVCGLWYHHDKNTRITEVLRNFCWCMWVCPDIFRVYTMLYPESALCLMENKITIGFMATQHVRTKLSELHAGSCHYVVGKSKQHSSVEATKWTSNALKRSVAGSCNFWNDRLHFSINFSKGTAKCRMVTWSLLSAPKSRRVETFAYSRVYRKMEYLQFQLFLRYLKIIYHHFVH